MANGSGISGLGVAMATAGAVVLYAGYKGVSPLEVLRTTMAGNAPSSLQSTIPSLADTPSPVGSAGVPRQESDQGGGHAGALIQAARSQIGKPYRWAATGPDTFDCSGLLVYCLRSIGVADVPRFTTVTFGSWASKRGARRLTRSQVAAGDIVVRTGHMGLAVSNTRMIHAPHTGSHVQEANIPNPQGSWTGWRLWPGPGSGASYWRGI